MSIQTPKPFVKGYKFRIYPTDDQKVLLEKTFGCVRFVWNKALAEAKQEYEHYLAHKDSVIDLQKPKVSGFDFSSRLVDYKSNPEIQWLKDVSSTSLQQAMLHLGSAFSTFFKQRKGYPSFKKKHGHQSFSLMTNSFRFKEEGFFIPKFKDSLKVVWSRKLPSAPTSATIIKTPTGKYYISFVCEYVPTKLNATGHIGIDLGIKDFLVTSEGIKVSNPKYLKLSQQNLRRKQQALSRKKKGSINRNKARISVALIHEHITNQRLDFAHKLSRKLINENQVIGIEKLRVKNMIRNRKLSKSISDVAWSSFVDKLAYKAKESQNTSLVYMDCWYPSSHLCNLDNYKLDYKLKLSDRQWTCPQCGTVHDRDINAAINIRNIAMQAMTDYKVSLGSGISIIATAQQ